jgi:hypothetical protein
MSTITTKNGTKSSSKDWAVGWFLRVTIAAGFLSAVADRFGLWGPPGAANIDWGAWKPFVDHTRLLTFYLPQSLVGVAAILATLSEVVLAVWLLVGWRTRIAAYASAALLLTFALSMTLAVGIKNPLNYATFTAAAAAFALAVWNTSPSQPTSFLKSARAE